MTLEMLANPRQPLLWLSIKYVRPFMQMRFTVSILCSLAYVMEGIYNIIIGNSHQSGDQGQLWHLSDSLLLHIDLALRRNERQYIHPVHMQNK